MSGRTRVVLPDGRLVRGYRKTLRKTRRGPFGLSVKSGSPSAIVADLPSPDYPVRLTSLLPKTILVSPGPHGFNVTVLAGNVVRIRGRTADHCFSLARCFFATVARESVAFTCHGSIARDDDVWAYGRHLTVVRGAVVVSGGLIEPRVYESAA
jgi:hypothetical protein